jgi:hypothetical protein
MCRFPTRLPLSTVLEDQRMSERELAEDEKRRNAITEWWAGKALRDFIASKRAALRTKVGDERE